VPHSAGWDSFDEALSARPGADCGRGRAGLRSTDRGAAAPSPGSTGRTRSRGFADVGLETFAASESFRALFGTASGRIVVGGVSVVDRHGFFGELRISRFQSTGERVFALNGQVFRLGIADDISLTPVELTGGVRWDRRGWTAVTYIGTGVGWHRYTESSLGAEAEKASQSFAGFHISGGVEFPMSRWLAIAGEAQ
jgi:hypothetical protein